MVHGIWVKDILDKLVIEQNGLLTNLIREYANLYFDSPFSKYLGPDKPDIRIFIMKSCTTDSFRGTLLREFLYIYKCGIL